MLEGGVINYLPKRPRVGIEQLQEHMLCTQDQLYILDCCYTAGSSTPNLILLHISVLRRK
jgi:hypothetical protein